MSGAFQRNAFQDNAFQVAIPSSIVLGGRSRRERQRRRVRVLSLTPHPAVAQFWATASVSLLWSVASMSLTMTVAASVTAKGVVGRVDYGLRQAARATMTAQVILQGVIYSQQTAQATMRAVATAKGAIHSEQTAWAALEATTTAEGTIYSHRATSAELEASAIVEGADQWLRQRVRMRATARPIVEGAIELKDGLPRVQREAEEAALLGMGDVSEDEEILLGVR